MNPVSRYSGFAQTIHWLTVIAVIAAFTFGPGGGESRVYLPARDFQRELHETLGMCVFALVLVRIVWRLVGERPPPPDVPRWMDLAAKAVQAGLYLLMVALPLTAISGAWLEGHDVTLLAGVHIAPWLGKSHQLGSTIAEIHTWLGDGILWLAGLHAAAALFHHLIMRDDVLVTMTPAWLDRPLSKLRW